jgi:uncharacterized FlaG/YvyC family protein
MSSVNGVDLFSPTSKGVERFVRATTAATPLNKPAVPNETDAVPAKAWKPEPDGENAHTSVSETLEHFVARNRTRVTFLVPMEKGPVVAQVINEQTGEIIRRSPMEKGVLLNLTS